MNRSRQLDALRWLGALGLAVVTGCAPSALPEPESNAPLVTQPLPAHGAASAEGTFFVAYDVRPEPIPLNEPFAIEVVVLDGATRSVAQEDVALAVDGRMPDHRHGMNREPRVRSLGGGRFIADGLLFHMPGYWELYLDVRRGIVTERAQIAVELE